MRMQMELGNLITILFGLCFVAAGVFVYVYMDHFVGIGHEASGVVVEVVYETGSRESRMHPVVRFKTADGREVLGRSGQHYNSEVGQAVQRDLTKVLQFLERKGIQLGERAKRLLRSP